MKQESPLWSKTHIQEALGDTLHLGGLDLTEHLATQAGIAPHWRVLDVACGTGQSVVHLRRRHGVQAFGCDVLLSQIQNTQSQNKQELGQRFRPLVVADAHHLPFLYGSMDMILCECALSLMTSPLYALKGFNNILKNKGIIAISDLYLQGERVDKNTASPLPQGSCLTWAAHRADIETLVREAGFKMISFEDHSYLLKDLAARLAFLGNERSCEAQASQHSTCSCLGENTSTAKVGYFSLLAKVVK